jgi:hyperosmotically inducible protein
MLARTTLAAALAATLSAAALLTLPGCAVIRGQETVGAYVDDATITTQVKAKMIDNKDVDAGAIKVETLNGTVMLSGFAKNDKERSTAEGIARDVKGVKSVKNEIAIRP